MLEVLFGEREKMNIGITITLVGCDCNWRVYNIHSFYLLAIVAVKTEKIIDPAHDKTNKMAYAPSKDSDQPGHPPSLIGVCVKQAWVLRYFLSTQQRLWSDWADAQADLSLRWAHIHFIGFFHVQVQFSFIISSCLNFISFNTARLMSKYVYIVLQSIVSHFVHVFWKILLNIVAFYIGLHLHSYFLLSFYWYSKKEPLAF